MVFEDFFYYSIFEDVCRPPADEYSYRMMEETSASVLKRTDSEELFYDTVYSPRLPYVTLKTYDEHIAYNNVIKRHKMLNDKKEMSENGVLFFFKEIFCCR